jgi:glucose/arabinose dehydrogenase
MRGTCYGGARAWSLRWLVAALAGAFALALPPAAIAQGVQLVPFGGRTFNQPFYVAAPPGDPSRVFVLQGNGIIRVVKDGVTLPTPFLNIKSAVLDKNEAGGCNECGMFSMAFAPDYSTSGLFYVDYTRASTDPGVNFYVRVEEFRASPTDPDQAMPGSGRILLEIPRVTSSTGAEARHMGGQLQFGPDGDLYISVGDGGDASQALSQHLDDLNGKVLRIDPHGAGNFDYSVPPDNPFVDGIGGNADEVYLSGLRNPWRFSFDRATGDLAIGDVGAADREEADFAVRGTGRGANYGWPCFEGTLTRTNNGCSPLPANARPPVLEYPHPAVGATAIMGGYVIRDEALPSLLGRYIFADLGDVFGDELQTATLSPSGATDQTGLGLTASLVDSFGEDACGHIYVVQLSGTVSRLEPTSGPFPCAPQPDAPVITDTDPDSPGNDNTPAVKGTAPARSTVEIYGARGCAGPVLASGSAAEFASPGLNVSVADNSSTTLFARAIVAGAASPCSSEAFDYFEGTGGTAEWSPPVGLSTPGGANPDVAADPNGNSVFTWRHFDGTNQRIQARVRSASGALSAVQTVSAAGQDAFDPRVAVDAAGDAVFTWRRFDGTNYRIESRVRSASGALSAVQTLSDPGQDAFDPQVAVDPAGDAVFAWRRSDGSNERIQSVARSAAGNLSAVQTLSRLGRDAFDPRVGVDSTGDAVFAWRRLHSGAYDIETRARSAAGSLSPVQTLGGDASQPQLAVDPNGDAVFTWLHFDGTTQRVEARARSAAGTLSGAKALSGAGSEGLLPQVDVDSGGDAVFAWERYSSGGYQVQARARSAAGALSPVSSLSKAAIDAISPQVGVDANGNAVFAWTRLGGPYDRIQARKRSAAGVFGPIVEVTGAGSSPTNPVLDMNGTGDAALGWDAVTTTGPGIQGAFGS